MLADVALVIMVTAHCEGRMAWPGLLFLSILVVFAQHLARRRIDVVDPLADEASDRTEVLGGVRNVLGDNALNSVTGVRAAIQKQRHYTMLRQSPGHILMHVNEIFRHAVAFPVRSPLTRFWQHFKSWAHERP